MYPGIRVSELGCGYGRIIKKFASDTHFVMGIHNAQPNIEAPRMYLQNINNVDVIKMNVNSLAFDDYSFDLVLCLQIALSVFSVDPLVVLKKVINTHRNIIFSTRFDFFKFNNNRRILT